MKEEKFNINKDIAKLMYDKFRNAPKEVKLGFIEEGECLDFYTSKILNYINISVHHFIIC